MNGGQPFSDDGAEQRSSPNKTHSDFGKRQSNTIDNSMMNAAESTFDKASSKKQKKIESIPLNTNGNESPIMSPQKGNELNISRTNFSVRSSAEMSSNFDINKWKKLIVGNVEMVQQRVD